MSDNDETETTTFRTPMLRTIARLVGIGMMRDLETSYATKTVTTLPNIVVGFWMLTMMSFTFGATVALSHEPGWVKYPISVIIGYLASTTMISLLVSALTTVFPLEGARMHIATTIRMIVVLALAAMSSIPMQFLVFAGDINREFDLQETNNREQIVSLRYKEVVERYDHLLRQATKQQEDRAATIVNARMPEFNKLLAKQARDRELMEARLSDVPLPGMPPEKLSREDTARRIVGGDNNRQTMSGDTEQIDRLLRALDRLEARSERERNKYMEETRRLTQVVFINGRKDIEEIEARQKADLDDFIGVRIRDDLSMQFGSAWNISRGFGARLRVLSTLSRHDRIVRFGRYAVTTGMCLVVLTLFLTKLLGRRVLGNPTTLVIQALEGNPEAQATLQKLGYDDSIAWRLLLPEWINRRRQRLRTAQFEVIRRRREYETAVRTLALPDETSGKYRRLGEIQNLLIQVWDRGLARSLARLEQCENALTTLGMDVTHDWPKGQWGADPREILNRTQPWEVTDTELEALGWKNPEVEEEQLEREYEALRALRSRTKIVVHELFSFLLHQLSEEDELFRKPRASTIAADLFAGHMAPHLAQIDLIKQNIIALHGSIPEPAEDVVDETRLRRHLQDVADQAVSSAPWFDWSLIQPDPDEKPRGLFSWLRRKQPS